MEVGNFSVFLLYLAYTFALKIWAAFKTYKHLPNTFVYLLAFCLLANVSAVFLKPSSQMLLFLSRDLIPLARSFPFAKVQSSSSLF